MNQAGRHGSDVLLLAYRSALPASRGAEVAEGAVWQQLPAWHLHSIHHGAGI